MPCITYRTTTERPITVELGTNRLVGVEPEALRTRPAQRRSPGNPGGAADDPALGRQGGRPRGGRDRGVRGPMTSPVRIGLWALAVVFSIWFGLSYIAVGIDPLHQLAWGTVISEGVRPLLTSQLTPLSHPLPIFVSVFLTPFGPEGSFIAYSILSAGAIAFLAYSTLPARPGAGRGELGRDGGDRGRRPRPGAGADPPAL